MNNSNAFELYGKYKNLYLFNTGKGSILFKTLSYDKFQTAKRISKAYPALAPIVEENIWEECVVEHTLEGTVDTLNAGIISTIVKLILHFSNPISLEKIESELNAIRNERFDIREEMIIKICKAFPAYKPEDIEAMEWNEQLKRLVQAEKILETTFAFAPAESKKQDMKKSKDLKTDFATKQGSDGMQYIDFDRENQIMERA